MQAQEKASEREERRKAGSPVEAGSWAWNEEFHDCHRFSMKRYPGVGATVDDFIKYILLAKK